MRSVSLSNKTVQKKVRESFIPLKLQIDYGTKRFPLDWPAMKGWKVAYSFMGGERVKGITGCSVVSPDLKLELASTGSAFVWQLFDSVAYDPEKFYRMLDQSLSFHRRYQAILASRGFGKRFELASLKREIKRDKKSRGRFQFPPDGFKAEYAKDLFRLSGDLPTPDKQVNF